MDESFFDPCTPREGEVLNEGPPVEAQETQVERGVTRKRECDARDDDKCLKKAKHDAASYQKTKKFVESVADTHASQGDCSVDVTTSTPEGWAKYIVSAVDDRRALNKAIECCIYDINNRCNALRKNGRLYKLVLEEVTAEVQRDGDSAPEKPQDAPISPQDIPKLVKSVAATDVLQGDAKQLPSEALEYLEKNATAYTPEGWAKYIVARVKNNEALVQVIEKCISAAKERMDALHKKLDLYSAVLSMP